MLPRFRTARRHVEQPAVSDVRAAVQAEAAKLAAPLSPGSRVAVACGSRGISQLAVCVREVVLALRARGCEPFIVPAMGSHGGATEAGQVALLAELGISEDSIGAPVRASMDAAVVHTLGNGTPLYFSRIALEADAVILVNRVKPHTILRGALGSGLMKMLAVGLGNRLGAETLHRAGLQAHVRPAAEALIDKTPVHGGIALVENWLGSIAHVEAVWARDFPERDQSLLRMARSYMPSIDIEPIDVLVVRTMGKHISGTGMDPHVIGLHRRQSGEPDRHIETVVVLDLADESRGNATGIGMADLTTYRLRDKINWKLTSTNCLTSGFLQGLKLPFALPSDREAIETAASLYEPRGARIVIIEDTLSLSRYLISANLAHEVRESPTFTMDDDEQALAFDERGNLLLPSLAAASRDGAAHDQG